MIINQYYLECLSHASYLVGDEASGTAVVIDPRRDVAEYLADADRLGLRITHVINTHLHADFLSGHLELAAATGAEMVFGKAAPVEFAALLVADGTWIDMGHVRLQVLETPGHTPESICITAYDGPDATEPECVFTGDTLFIGDVGRPDLLASVGVTADELGRMLYHSLHDKLIPLADDVKVYPAHGAGSACGKNLSTETMSTMREQRALNYALQPMSEDDFVAIVTDGQPAAPPYFVFDAITNRKDRALFDEQADLRSMTLAELDESIAAGAVLIDTRQAADFAAGHLIGSVNVGLDGRFAEYAGSVVEPHSQIVLVCEEGAEREAVTRLARIGFDNVIGHLEQPHQVMAENPERTEHASRLTADQLRDILRSTPDIQLVDIRNPGELSVGVIDPAKTLPLGSLMRQLDELDPARPTVVYCAGGYRSSAGASLLRTHGFEDVSDLLGGYAAWEALAG
ncbi:MAG: MBL fold metallo-hydrolase [Actinomycetales bacterium]|nr:MBL fold metallo-hydrolase [Actinomycetales bacterium]